jgi:hypothetical protein
MIKRKDYGQKSHQKCKKMPKIMNILESGRAVDGNGHDQVVQEQESLLAKAEAERKILGKQLMLV